MDNERQEFVLSRRQGDESNEKTLVFVYGSLMQGYGNHRLLQEHRAHYVGRAVTAPLYTLVDLMAFPGLVEGGKTRVRGEVYEVDSLTLAKLDRLEGHPDFYQRKPIAVGPRSNTLRHEYAGAAIWAYVLPREEYGQRPHILSGDWRRQKPIPRSHGKSRR